MKLARFQRPDLWRLPAFDDQLAGLRDEINRSFESLFNGGNRFEFFNTWTPALDVYENEDQVIVQAEVPGINKDDIDISLHGEALTISGERKEEQRQEGESSRTERIHGRFSRTVTLPKVVNSDKVTASYEDGILTVTLPKAEEAKPRKIQVKTS